MKKVEHQHDDSNPKSIGTTFGALFFGAYLTSIPYHKHNMSRSKANEAKLGTISPVSVNIREYSALVLDPLILLNFFGQNVRHLW
jgi:hypothetical protein